MMTPSVISPSNLPTETRETNAPIDDAPSGSVWLSPSAQTSFLAGFFTVFTVSFVGEMPVGELVLMAAAGWAALCVVFNKTWPGPLLRSRFLWSLLIAQLIALGSYIFSDLYRHSFPLDMA